MQCPHCQQEHPDSARVCPTTGLSLGLQTICPSCGAEARPGAHFCAACGATLPRPQPPVRDETGSGNASNGPAALPPPILHSTSSSPPSPDVPRETHPTLPASSQKYTRPSVSLVERSRRETRPSRIAISTSQRAAQLWARQSRLWHLLGYGLLILVILLGVAGLYLLWGQLRPQPAPLPTVPSAKPAAVLPPTMTPETLASSTPLAVASATPAPTRPPASATSAPVLLPPSESASPTVVDTPLVVSEVTPDPTPAASSSLLAFYSDKDEQPGVYVMDPDDPENLSALPLPEGYEIAAWPAFCGDQVAFEVQDRALTLPRWIYLYSLANQSLRPLEFASLTPLRLSAPSCSPDGRYLAASANLDGDWELVVIELASGDVVYRSKSPTYPQLGHASWPLGQNSIWWMGTRVNGFYDVNETTAYLDDRSRQNRTFANGKYPAISPDGSRLAFFCGNLLYLCVSQVSSGEILFQLPVSYFKQVGDLPVPATASWSSDGQWLYFTSSVTGNWDIYRVRADGSQIQNLTEDWRTDEFMPAAN